MNLSSIRTACIAAAVWLAGFSASGAGPNTPDRLHQIGVARSDITPDYPVRLSGYGVRREECEGVEQRIWAKALAIGSDAEGPALLLTVDNCGVSDDMRAEVLRRLATKVGIADAKFAICSSHTHSAPCLTGVLPNLFSRDIPPDHQGRIDRYTRELTDKLEQVSLAALADRREGRLAWSVGKAGFAKNRRTPDGPVDHDVPVLKATDKEGRLRAVLANYACHCTTVTGTFNKICGDWAGYAQEYIERDHPGAVALVAIGCGADQNPHPRPGFDLAQKHGAELATEVKRLLASETKPVGGPLNCRIEQIQLPFDTLPTRAEWEEKAATGKEPIAYHARKNLARLDRGEPIPTHLPYKVQVWNFGSGMAMIFLPGEVVVDYSLRLKKEFDAARLWVNAYANDVPCYIPSRRILAEGGYEGGGAMVYYDRPTRFAPEVEDLIVGTVHRLMPTDFAPRPAPRDPPPLSPTEALKRFRVKPGLVVELVAAEPLVVDPVAIDFAADGKLWVVEMRDYPMGMDGNWQPGGRVKFLEDLDGDGVMDKATVFLDGLPFPTGLMAWNKGVLVCAAPDILYAEDTDGDGKADKVETLFTGFVTDNYQARVNSLTWGLDNWIYGANGLRGGVIRSSRTGREVDIRGRDFRMRPSDGSFEPVSGLTQQGRVRDDWGNWFGCDNSHLLWHYPMPDHYLQRNPHVVAPNPRVSVPAGPEPNRLFPASEIIERFNQPEHANRVTSACGLGIYRDELLGGEYKGDAFICEPVHNLVHRRKLSTNGVTFTGRRAEDEQASEFLASTDNWFRPAQAVTGPDGALWVVDMYRYVVEHPRFISAERLAQLDVRAGQDKGRIYRIRPEGKPLRPPINFASQSTLELVVSLDTPNGARRDLAHQELVRRKDSSAEAALARVFQLSTRPETRLQALCAMSGLRAMSIDVLTAALQDTHPEVRRHAIRLCEPLIQAPIGNSERLLSALFMAANDESPAVRFQLALTLGQSRDPRVGLALGHLARVGMADEWMRAAILSSAASDPVPVLNGVLQTPMDADGRGEMMGQLIATTVARKDATVIGGALAAVAPPGMEKVEAWQIIAVASLQDALDHRKLAIQSFEGSGFADVREAAGRIKSVYKEAGNMARDLGTPFNAREAAVRLLGRGYNRWESDLPVLSELMRTADEERLRAAALEQIRRSGHASVPALLLTDWAGHSPSTRAAVIATLLGRAEWIIPLLDAVQKGTVAAKEIPALNRSRLMNHSNEAIKQRAHTLFQDKRPEDRSRVLAEYQAVAGLRGDAAKGGALFDQYCASCHAIKGRGHDVGPDLTAFHNKSPQDLLAAIIDPNAIVEPRFIHYTVETRDGRSLSGVIQSETANSVVLAQAGGIRETILRADITSIKASSLSLMPEGLEQALPPGDMADLIAFLKEGSGKP